MIFDAIGTVRDSVRLVVGRDDAPSTLLVARVCTVARATVAAGSRLAYAPGAQLVVLDELRYRIRYADGFNLTSSPVHPIPPAADVVYAGANSDVFRFEAGYHAVESVFAGEGYWVSFPDSVVVEYRGRMVGHPIGFVVRAGWNIVGATSIAIDVAALETIGTAILSGPFDERSELVTHLEPGRGYWIEVSADGAIVVP